VWRRRTTTTAGFIRRSASHKQCKWGLVRRPGFLRDGERHQRGEYARAGERGMMVMAGLLEENPSITPPVTTSTANND
jgi:hypothetical protein